MGLTVGPATWHPDYQRYIVSTSALGASVFGGFLFCKSLGIAYIVAPYSTQVCSAWAGGQYNAASVGNKCCVSEWSTLQTALTNAGLTPSQWFVPSLAQLQSGYACRSFWGNTNPCWTSAFYWTSTEMNSGNACGVYFVNGDGLSNPKTSPACVRAFRCVTY